MELMSRKLSSLSALLIIHHPKLIYKAKEYIPTRKSITSLYENVKVIQGRITSKRRLGNKL
jgi:hypothetical protein